MEQLPLVEFVPEVGLTHEQVMEYLRIEPVNNDIKSNEDDLNPNDMDYFQTQTLKINAPTIGSTFHEDPFTAKLLNLDLVSDTYFPVQIDAMTLKAMSLSEVIVIKQKPLKWRYFKSVLPEVRITQCSTCHKLFISDDYEFAVLHKGYCPYCRTPKTY